MKILYATLEVLTVHKGSVVHVKETVSSLHNRGHEIGLIAGAPESIGAADHAYNIDLGSAFQWSSSLLRGLSRLLSPLLLLFYLLRNLSRYDVIYARDYHAALLSYPPSVLFRKKLVWEINGLAPEERRMRGRSPLNVFLSIMIQYAEGLAVRCSHSIVAVTAQIKSYLIHRYGCAPGKVSVVSNGVNISRFHVIGDQGLTARCREDFGISNEKLMVIFVGNLAPWQGVEYLIRAAPTVVQEVKQTLFLIVGDGSMKETFKTQVAHLGLTGHFIFPGMIEYERIPLLINCADLCVLPKRRLDSGYSPIKLYEYMACGKPVVSSRVEGLEVVEEEDIGILVEPEDSNSLGQALIALLKNPQMRREMGERGAKIARERFDWESKVDAIERLLTGLA
jgi:alpha-maltose-1-phosphate synthase